ncbi:hypothetical protein [Cryptosporangium sp. NPDC048952]|uniref:hypothetical protein n=1 Tax=Cryptosporangium sp. NPDC048952 TaxID=3363961 RepID=UPI003712F519
MPGPETIGSQSAAFRQLPPIAHAKHLVAPPGTGNGGPQSFGNLGNPVLADARGCGRRCSRPRTTTARASVTPAGLGMPVFPDPYASLDLRCRIWRDHA